jgi:nucleotide-binding universal stress UspA family protein
MIEKILFPVDFSPSCAAMGAYVRRAADMFGSQVALVYVSDLTSNNGFELMARTMQEVAEDHLGAARERLDSFLQSEFPPASCTRILCSGEAAAQIAEVARTRAFDLIIMPTHAGRFRRMLLGSTTAKVLNDAGCLVMTSIHAETISPHPLEHRVWVCAIGLSADSERVLGLAGRAAAAANARLCVIHAVGENAGTEPHRRLEGLAEKVGCVAELRIVAGPVKDTLLDAARDLDADALIVGRRLPGAGYGRLRDLTYSLVRDASCPVLSV